MKARNPEVNTGSSWGFNKDGHDQPTGINKPKSIVYKILYK